MELEFISKSSDITHTNHTSIPDELDHTTSVFLSFTFCTLFVIGICGNLFTIIALLQSPTLKVQAATKFVISLSIGDLLFCTNCVIFRVICFCQKLEIQKVIPLRF